VKGDAYPSPRMYNGYKKNRLSPVQVVMLRSDRRTSAASRRCFRLSAPSWSASRTIIDASENSSYHPHIKMRARREVLGLVSVSYERTADVKMIETWKF
jgi:hypothetical protein